MERNDWGYDFDAHVVSMNELHDLYDLLDEMWSAKFEEVKKVDAYDTIRYTRLHGTLDGIESAKGAVSDLMRKAIPRLPRK